MTSTDSTMAQRVAGLSPSRRAMLEQRLASARPGAVPRRVPEGEPAPLSYIQPQMWTAEQFGTGMATYNVPYAFRVRGPLDTGALDRALCRLVARHAALRTEYRVRDGEPVQVVLPPGAFRVDHRELSTGAEATALG